MAKWYTTYTILASGNGHSCPYTSEDKDILLRIQHLSGSKRALKTIVHPSKWSRKPGLLESLKKRQYPWLVKNAIDKESKIITFPANVSNSKREQLIFLTLSKEDIDRFHPTLEQ